MHFQVSEACLDDWLADFDSFKYDFLRQSQTLCKVVGYFFDFDQQKLKTAYDGWTAACARWQSEYVMPDSNGLSHIKIMSLMTFHLASIDWVRDLYEFDSAEDRLENAFGGDAKLKSKIRGDINGGGCAYLGMQFALQIISAFEYARDDKAEPFIFRMTYDLEHDMMVYLCSERRDEMGFFLIMKALYARL